MTISKKLEKALNEQIAAEMWSANLYTSMSFFCEKEGFEGFSAWLKKQAAEETEHAYMMAHFLIERGGTAKVSKLNEVPGSWKTLLDMFKAVYAHECHVSELIDKLLDMAVADKDKASQDFFWQFVREQVEEEATASDIVSKIEKFGQTALFQLDSKFGQRK
ncbi:MAG: ferritin [Lentimicrobiaceae bacterium]|nr:ferritin [Lentimicrobiaceae bacterium]